MLPKRWYLTGIFFVLIIKTGSVYHCSSNTQCRCHKLGKKLFADCSNLNLDAVPHFTDDVIGINFAKNEFSKIPQSLPKHLMSLDMSNNKLVSLDNESFSRYQMLQNLSIFRNLLREVSIGTFALNSHLQNLDISFNRILTIDALFNVTYDLQSSNIRRLNFQKLQCTYGVSQIMRKYHISFLRHTDLLELDIASNRITSFETGFLNALPKSLRILNIADNVLSFGLYIFEFSLLPNLKILNISFQDFFHQFGKNGDFLENCNDTRVSTTCKIKNYINSNNIMHENNFASSTISLEVFSKPSTNLSFYLPRNLQKLYCHDTLYKVSIQEINLGLNNTLTHLFLQRNIIYELKGPIRGPNHVKYLDFSGNLCTFVAKSFFFPFVGLDILNLSNNALSQIFESDENGEFFQYQKRLYVLDLSLNRIAHLPKLVFQHNANMSRLNLSFNSLSDFIVRIDHMKQISELDLSYNQLTQLGNEVRRSLDAITTRFIKVHLVGNNLKCSCENLDFLKWLRDSNRIEFVGMNNYTCQFGNTSATSFNDIEKIVQVLEKRCSTYLLIIILITTFIIVTVTITISRIIYRYRWKLRYMYYVAKEKYKAENQLCKNRVQSSFRFDAFISYADEERLFVFALVKYLEEECNLRLCIHHRDFIPGTGIADNITNAIHCSRHTVCFMTSNFLQSHWCMFELNMARMEAIYSRNGENVLLLVALEKSIMKQLPLHLMDLVNSNSYLEYPEEKCEIEVAAFLTKLGETLGSKL